ncbi:MAG: ferric reductase-like transmembrane domain-containing protein [Verrucomicrobia bacterium]|nr:ferric reductase-like transmembrane domain-containing protein [Verrucomicrobiota bacterium]
MQRLENLLRRKVVIWTLLVLPGLWPLWLIFVAKSPSVLADPLKYVLHHLGFTACVLLATVLAFTPLRVLWPKWGVALALNRHRRLVGVASFAYAALHFTAHLVYEGGTDASFLLEILRNSVKKPFQLVGMITLAILLVLAITSLNAAIKWLGAKAWKNLHRLAYLAAALAAYHQAIARKTFPLQVVWIFGPLVLLELARMWKHFAPEKSGAGT